jgi:hypothetical protein
VLLKSNLAHFFRPSFLCFRRPSFSFALDSLACSSSSFPVILLFLALLSLAMFSYTLSLGLALVPFVSAAIIDVQVGAQGLTYSPEAIVRPNPLLLRVVLTSLSRLLMLATKLCSTSMPRTTPSPSPHSLIPAAR